MNVRCLKLSIVRKMQCLQLLIYIMEVLTMQSYPTISCLLWAPRSPSFLLSQVKFICSCATANESEFTDTVRFSKVKQVAILNKLLLQEQRKFVIRKVLFSTIPLDVAKLRLNRESHLHLDSKSCQCIMTIKNTEVSFTSQWKPNNESPSQTVVEK